MTDDGTLHVPREPDRPDDPNSGTHVVIGNYRLVEKIGSGAMGDVYLARHLRFAQRKYAIKLIREAVTTQEARKRFEREILAMDGLVHPNLVYASDAGVDAGRMYLVMEYVDGQDLQHLIDAHGPIRAPLAADILRKICAGVSHAHQCGVVHRDIKPANVILSEDREVKVLDLGIASLQSGATSRMTQGGSLMGTAAFIAPELWDDATNVSPASDVYAIGCTAYCLIAGTPPFAGKERSLVQVMSAHQQTDPIPLHICRDDVPEQISNLIQRSLSKDPDRRFQDAGEFGEQLAPYCEPLTKKSTLFSSAMGPSDRRTTITERIEDESSLGNVPWIVSLVVLAIAAASLINAYGGAFSTEAWRLFFGQLGDPSQPPRLGLGVDAIRVLIAVPLACYLLARDYRGEVRRCIDLRHWSGSAVFVRLALLIVCGFLTFQIIGKYWHAEWTHVAELEGVGDRQQNLVPSRWYSGYAVITQVLLPVLTLVFPFAWFLASDMFRLRRRLGQVIDSQNETSYPGRMSENLHRFGTTLRAQVVRNFALLSVAALILQYDYWIFHFAASEGRRSIELASLFWGGILVACIASIVMIAVALIYAEAYEKTSRLIFACGSIKDEQNLSRIGLRWLIMTTITRFSGIGCLSIAVLLGHSFLTHEIEMGKSDPPIVVPLFVESEPIVPEGEGQGNTVIPLNPNPDAEELSTASWLPPNCETSPNAKLVLIDIRGFRQRLYSEVHLRVALPPANETVHEGRDDWQGPDSVSFVLVPQTRSSDPSSFYMMKHKVTAELFARFEQAYPESIDQKAAMRRQRDALDPDNPVYNVTGREAIRFAELVCNAKLPTREQWDAAFGRYLDAKSVQVAIDTLDAFPLIIHLDGTIHVDRSIQDISPWGCWEMGSRGKEFTRYDSDNEENITDWKNIGEIQLRGRSQHSDQLGPLTPETWEKGVREGVLFGIREPDAFSHEITFRVVLEQDDGP